MGRASLYVHAPFCRAKCGYCAFYSLPAGPAGPTPEQLARYLAALAAEAEHLTKRYGPLDVPTLFFGGGTPSLLGAPAIEAILTLLRRHFSIEVGAEISLEANPDSATPEFLSRVRAAGVNRLSLGVQSLDDGLLRRMNRIHDAAQAREAVAAARAAGFANLGLDLIFGLPGQGVEHWLATLRQAVDLAPEHLSCYGLSIEPGTPLAADAAALADLPDEDAQAEMYLRGAELLEAAGYRHYEISNFARPGRECRHNGLGWQGGDVLGLGPAAVSTLRAADGTRGLRWANPQDFDAWEALILAGRAGEHGREELPPALLLREGLMLALRTAEGLDLAAWREQGGEDLPRTRGALLAQLAAAGLTRIQAGKLALTRQGMLVSNSVIRSLGFESL